VKRDSSVSVPATCYAITRHTWNNYDPALLFDIEHANLLSSHIRSLNSPVTALTGLLFAGYGVITLSTDALHRWDTAVDDALAAINSNDNPKMTALALTMLHVRTLQVLAYFMCDLIMGAPHNPCTASQGSCQYCSTSSDYQALPSAILVLLVLLLLLPLMLLLRVRSSLDEYQYRK
jgi:hypothetical protein